MNVINLPSESVEAATKVLRNHLLHVTVGSAGGGASGGGGGAARGASGGATGGTGRSASGDGGGGAAGPMGQAGGGGSSANYLVPPVTVENIAAQVLVEALAAAERAGWTITVTPPAE